MANYGQILEVTFPEMATFCKTHSVLIASTILTGVGYLAVRRYMAGGVCTSTARLDGKTVIITGANTGIGKVTARELAKRGARVIMACRDLTKAERAAADIRNELQTSNVTVKVVDLANQQSIRTFCKNINETEDKVNILINNAGVMACPHWETDDGLELQMGTNHFGHFLLTNLLLEKIKQSAPSRIITLSSLAHERGEIHLDDINFKKREYKPWRAYNSSKLANVLFSRELHRRVQGSGVSTFSIHPGIVMTELGRHMNPSYSGKDVWRYLLWPIIYGVVMKTAWQGAQTSIYCSVTEDIEQHSGKYFSDCAVKRESVRAQDNDLAAQLWQLSEHTVGISN